MKMPDQPISRRALTVRGIYGLASIMGIALSAPAAMYIFTPPRSEKESAWVDAGIIDDLRADTPQQIPVLRVRFDAWKLRTERDSAWIVKNPDGKLIAFSPRCTHLGCAYRWDTRSKTFKCPCHGSSFSMTGAVISGPAPRPLDRYHVKVEGNRLWLGKLEKAGDSTHHG